jgi:hypothetical protein
MTLTSRVSDPWMYAIKVHRMFIDPRHFDGFFTNSSKYFFSMGEYRYLVR